MICLTFDVEERFHSHLTPDDAPRRWSAGDRIRKLLDQLEAGGHRATFFMVGDLAEHYPDLIRRMVAGGFEIGSHSQTHPRLDGPDREHIRNDIARSKAVLEDLSGKPVRGFRAPSWSARREDNWLWEHLQELGFEYDSSLFPFKTHMYGSFGNPVRPFRLPCGLLEIPPSVSALGPLRLPFGGGFYFRLYPSWLTRGLIDRDVRSGHAPIVYFHPWEFDESGDTMEKGLLMRVIGNLNVAKTWDKFTDLIGRYETAALGDTLESLSGVR